MEQQDSTELDNTVWELLQRHRAEDLANSQKEGCPVSPLSSDQPLPANPGGKLLTLSFAGKRNRKAPPLSSDSRGCECCVRAVLGTEGSGGEGVRGGLECTPPNRSANKAN